ncbi:MAG: hypothetical protein PVH88_03750 [Ignavibacteria bacterium]|jgi:hypothetical protein
MYEENKVNIEVTEEDITEIKSAIDVLTTKLQPYLISLSTEERKELPKMSDKTLPFVQKVMDYLDTNPEFASPYMDKDAFKIDMKSVEDLTAIFNPLNQILANLDDTIMLAGSEAYVAALSYYNSVKLASKMDIPNSKTIYEDLKTRFKKSKTSSVSETVE